MDIEDDDSDDNLLTSVKGTKNLRLHPLRYIDNILSNDKNVATPFASWITQKGTTKSVQAGWNQRTLEESESQEETTQRFCC